MAICLLVLATADVDPEVLAVGGFDDGLVKVCVGDEPIKPLVEATAFSAVKSVYFLQKFGAESIFKMKFERYMYGPYCDQVRHVLHAIDGGYIRGFADMSKRPFEPFDIIPEKMSEVKYMVESDILLNDIVSRTCQFLEGYWDDFSLELMSSVDFLITESPASSVDDVYDKLGAWTDRKKKLFSDKNKVLKVYNHILS